MPSASRLLPAVFLGVAALTLVGTASAQPGTEVPPAETDPAPRDPTLEHSFAAHARTGVEHYHAGRWLEALREFDAALQYPAPDTERASIEFNAGACLFALARYDEAQQRFIRSAKLDPNAGTLARLNAGLAAVRAGNLDLAAEQLGVTPETEEERARHEELRIELAQARSPAVPAPDSSPTDQPAPPPTARTADPRLPAPGLHGWLLASGGYDSNAAQSGVSDTVGSSDTSPVASGFLSALGSLHGTHHFATRRAGRLYYLGDWLGLLSASVRDLSLQSHTVGGRYYSAIGDHQLLRVGGGGSMTLSGLERLEPMMAEGFLDLRFQWDPPGASLTRFDGRLGATGGLGDWQYLTGINADSRLTHRFEWEHFELALAAGGRYTGLGTLRYRLEAADLPGCIIETGAGPGPGAVTDCTGETYVIPLSWAAPRAEVELLAYPHERVTLGTRAGLEYRVYLEESSVSRVPSSRKRRSDARWRLAASSELDLDRGGHATALLEYRVLGSHSNVAYDANDPEHDLDYDDRTFLQHVLEAGFMLTF